MEIKPYEEKFREQMVAVWERSVRSTHDFVSADDITFFKEIVRGIDFNSFPVYCLTNEDTVLGFLGVAEKNLEMLFLDPDLIGQGHGKRLMNFALQELEVEKVDVNEQNGKAVSFYSKFGFVTYERTDKDSQGKDYPILKMRLERKSD